jgi:putative acetyltransferase
MSDLDVLMLEPFIIRPIAPEDNAQMATLLVSVLEEFGCIGPGFASSDPELADLYSAYQTPTGQPVDRGYWVIVHEASGQVYGGGGFARLKGTRAEEGVCELQKMYMDSSLRGRGYGRMMLELCIQQATRAGYRTMYLETTTVMAQALKLYEKFGFRPLPTYLGDTGHRSCNVFMSRSLNLLEILTSTP